ncbi:unnamed protein product, partial [Choristocarpus tenellus]
MDPAPSRCFPSRDAGVTRGSEALVRDFCIFFARGSCARGYDCHKLHFIPTGEDDALQDNATDCFGRQRTASHEDDDRDGVGCLLKENRTLWVGGITVGDEAAVREQLQKNFSAWGDISSIRIIKNKSCGFVQYAFRANSEFAKEAMGNQYLLRDGESNELCYREHSSKGGEQTCRGPRRSSSGVPRTGRGESVTGRRVLHVRWASEDPNPRAVQQVLSAHAQTLLAAQVSTGSLPADAVGDLPGADRALLKKARLDPNKP